MDNVVFKQSVMGFNRTQVLEYIDTLVKQLKDQESEYTQRKQELEAEVDSLYSKCAENRQDLALTVEKIKELSDELDFFKKNNEELKGQIEHYKNLILSKDGEIVNLKKNTFSLQTRVDLLSAENEGWKKRQDKIGETLIEANLKAEEIIRNAEAKAEATKKSIEAQAAQLSGDVVNIKEEIYRVEKQLEESFAKLQHAMTTLDSSAKTIEQQVDEYKNRIDALETSLSDIAEGCAAGENGHNAQFKDKKLASLADTYSVKAVPKPVQKKSLTDSVLETITKIIG